MKIKLKDIDKKISIDNNHQGLELMAWVKINKGNIIEVDSIPALCKDMVAEIKAAPKKDSKPEVKKESKGDK